MSDSTARKVSTKEEMQQSLAKNKEILKALKAEREKNGEVLSGVVAASMIANSIRMGLIHTSVTSELGRELTETINRAERVTNDVDIIPLAFSQNQKSYETVEKLQPGKMIVINLPGNGTSLTDNDHNPLLELEVRETALAAVQDFFNFMGDVPSFDESLYQCVGCFYSHKINHLIEDFNENGVPHDGIFRFANLFDPLISENGKKIDVEDAVRNMKKVVLRGQCFGTLVAAELEKALEIKLACLGYSDVECAKILSAPTAIFSSSPVALDKQPKHFKVVAYANCADKLIPTIKGSPNYQKYAGLTDEEVLSDNFQMIKKDLRPGYKLILCSSIDLPETEDLREYIRMKHPEFTQEQLDAYVEKKEREHDFGAVSNPIKSSSQFMQHLRHEVQEMMTHAFSSVYGAYLSEQCQPQSYKKVESSIRYGKPFRQFLASLNSHFSTNQLNSHTRD